MEILSLMDMVSAIENLSNNTQIFLKEALKNILYQTKGATPFASSADLEAVLAIGLLQEIDGKYDVSEQARKKIRKLYTYLIRKFDTESYLDPHTFEMVAFPKGASFTGTISVINGETVVAPQFPDDEITALLDLFDSNPCKYWSAK